MTSSGNSGSGGAGGENGKTSSLSISMKEVKRLSRKTAAAATAATATANKKSQEKGKGKRGQVREAQAEAHAHAHAKQPRHNHQEILSYVSKLERQTVAILEAGHKREEEEEAQRVRDECGEEEEGKLVFRFNKFFLEKFGELCYVDLFACDQFKNSANRIRMGKNFLARKLANKLKLHRITRSEWFRSAERAHWWPRMIFGLWLASIVHITLYMVHQYEYDFFRFRLKRVHWLNRTHPELQHEQPLEREDYLMEQIASSRESLLAVGAPMRELTASYLPQCICWLVLIVSLLCYYATAPYSKYKQPYDFYFIRNFLGHRIEQANCKRLVRDQSWHFVESSRSFTHALMEFSEASLGKRLFLDPRVTPSDATGAGAAPKDGDRPEIVKEQQQQQQQQRQRRQPQKQPPAPPQWSASGHVESNSNNNHNNNHLQMMGLAPGDDCAHPVTAVLAGASVVQGGLKETSDGSLACRQLKQIVNSGLLMPMNQSSGWIIEQLDKYASLVCFSIVYALILNATFGYILYTLNDWRLATWRDILLSLEMLFLQSICINVTVFHATNLMFSCYDQIKFASRLRALIKHVVCLNNLRFHSLLRPAYKIQAQEQQQQQQKQQQQLVATTAAPATCTAGKQKSSPPQAASSKLARRASQAILSKCREATDELLGVVSLAQHPSNKNGPVPASAVAPAKSAPPPPPPALHRRQTKNNDTTTKLLVQQQQEDRGHREREEEEDKRSKEAAAEEEEEGEGPSASELFKRRLSCLTLTRTSSAGGGGGKLLPLAISNTSLNAGQQQPALASPGEQKRLLEIEQLERKMNYDLLLAIMHYRVFFARMVVVIKPFGTIAMAATVIMFLVPFIGRLHLPYFLDTFERQVIVTFSLLLLVPVNLTLIGPVYMHKRCLDLYGSLNSLLAHAVDITNHQRGRDIYDQHLLSLLRRELAMHQGITPKFATTFAGLSFTYPNLVRLHFYFGFLLLSIIAENRASEQELSVSVFDDPFGLF